MPKKIQENLCAGQERVLEISPGVNMTFCWCPPGEFIMGSPESEQGRCVNETQVNVLLTKGFWMAKTQVTQFQWTSIREINLSEFRGENLPVDTVNFIDIQKFLEKLNSKIGAQYDGKIALPTEAQWEYACRAGQTGPYSGGAIDDIAWYEDNSECETHPVGLKQPNAWGLHDMHGNVAEWCSDYYCEKMPGGIDPHVSAQNWSCVARGGSWQDISDYCRAAYRYSNPPTTRRTKVGFRPVLVPSE